MSSQYPNQYDIFTEKKDRIIDEVTKEVIQEGDDILASHINNLQDSVLSIENSLGLKPAGTFSTISERLAALSNDKLTTQSLLIYNGNAININNYSSSLSASRFIKKFNIAIIGIETIDNNNVSMSSAKYIISETYKYTKVFISIDCYGKTSSDIIGNIYLISQTGAYGVFLDNFDYSDILSRSVQNEILDNAHQNSLKVIVSALNPDDIFSSQYVLSRNQTYTKININNDDYFLLKGFGINGLGYQNLEQMNIVMSKLMSYRDVFGTKILASSYISNSDADKQQKFFYLSAASSIYSIDGLYAGEEFTSNTKETFPIVPIIGSLQKNKSDIYTNADKTLYYRETELGEISISYINGEYKFDYPRLKIPGTIIDPVGFNIDMSQVDLTGLDASAITTGIFGSGRMINSVIDAINASDADKKIPMSRIDQTNNDFVSGIVQSMLPVFNYATTDSSGLRMTAPIYATSINSSDNIVISGINKGLTVSSGYVSANTGSFATLSVSDLTQTKKLKVDKFVGTPALTPTSNIEMLSNMLNIASIDGLNKFAVKIYVDGHTSTREYTLADLSAIETIDEYSSSGVNQSGIQLFEAYYTDSTGTKINSSTFTGSIAKYSTTIKTTEDVSVPITVYKAHANDSAYVYCNGAKIDTIPSGTSFKQVTFQLKGITTYPNGQEIVIICESGANNDTSIKITPNIFEMTGDGLSYIVSNKIYRIDCYMNKATKITGEIIETGTVKTEHMSTSFFEAQDARINSLAVDVVSAAQISTTQLKAGTIDTSIVSISGGDVLINNQGIVVNGNTGKGIKITTTSNKQILLNSNGLSSDNFNISSDGNASFKGNIVADSGTLKDLSVTGTIVINNVDGFIGSVVAGNTILRADGIDAKQGLIGGWILGNSTISGGNVVLDKDGIITVGNTSSNFVRLTGSNGLFEANNAIVSGSITATGGSIGGWTIYSGKMSSSNISLDSANGKIAIGTNILLNNDGSAKLGAISIGADGSISSLNNKFLIDSLGNASFNGALTSTSGTIGGWVLNTGKLTSGNITLDASNSKITIGSNVELNNDGSATLGRLSVTSAGSVSIGSNFSVDISGNVSMTGAITASSGSIGGWTVNASTIVSSGNIITLDNTNKKITITDGSATQVVIGNYSGSNYGIQAGDAILASNGLTINGTSSSISLGGGAFSVNGSGTLIAKDGYFGDIANRVAVDYHGLLLGTGRIADSDINPKIRIDSTGITAKAGYIGNTVIDDKGIVAGNVKITDSGVKVAGNKSVIIDDGTMVVKDDAGYDVVSVGDNSGSFGVKIESTVPHSTVTGAKTASTTANGKEFAYPVATIAENRVKLKKVKFVITL